MPASNNNHMERTITGIAGVVALLVALLLPAGYFAMGHQYLSATTRAEVEINAQIVTQFINTNPLLWQFEQHRLEDLLAQRSADGAQEARRLFDTDAKEIAKSADDLAAPLLSRASRLLDAGRVVGSIEITRSLRPLLWSTAMVALLSSALAFVVFASLRILPLRALRAARQALQEREAQLQRAQIMTKLGHVITRADGSLETWSESLSQVIGVASAELPRTARAWLDIVHPADRAMFRERCIESAKNRTRIDVEYRVHRADGTWIVLRHLVEPLLGQADSDGGERWFNTIQDISERKMNEARIDYLATNDALTDLPNRSVLDDRLTQAIAQARRGKKRLAVLLINLDRFKVINDGFGYWLGDLLLKAVAARLKTGLRESDTVARLAGDEFVVMVSGLADTDDARTVTQKVLAKFSDPFVVEGHELIVTASIGVSVYPVDGDNSTALLKNADAAMYSAKEEGRNGVQFYTSEMGIGVQERVDLENALSGALERQEFELHYQPKVDLQSGQIQGLEALIRWRHPELGTVSPARFISLAEETGLIVPIGEWVLRTACAQAAAWHAAGYPDLSMAVNLSARQFRQQNIPQLVRRVLAETGLAAKHLELELTEGLLMQDSKAVIEALRELKSIGVTLSLDDFGTGYSSLSYLQRFPIDVVKIDRSFVKDIASHRDDVAIVQAIISLGHSLGLRVVAEGVETEEQLAFLVARGCDEIQGYFFSRPLPAKDMSVVLQEGRRLPDSVLHEQQRPRTLLLVDDDENIVAALKRLLRHDGYQVLTAKGGREGLELLAQNEVDVIVSDQRMLGMTGVEFLRAAKTLHPDTVRIVLSGYTELQSVTDAINEGAIYKFLTKPWEDEQLREHIAEAFRRKEMADENRRLGIEVRTANQELAAANRQQQAVLANKEQQIARDGVSLRVVREALQHIPFPVIGVGDDDMVAFVNAAADTLFGQATSMLGCDARTRLPELFGAAAGACNGEGRLTTIENQVFRVTCLPMGENSQSRGKLMTLTPSTMES